MSLGLADLGAAPAGAFVVPARLGLIGAVVWGVTLSSVIGLDLEEAWRRAAESIVEEHNLRADPRAAQEAIGPAQSFALELLRDPTVILPEGGDRAAEALAVQCSSAVRRELNGIQAELREERIARKRTTILSSEGVALVRFVTALRR